MGAMPDEVDQLCARLENVTKENYAGVEYHCGTLQGKQVVVVDEAIFTGTTLRIVCQMLREAGAAKVHIAIPTPMSNCRCAQYVLPAMPPLADSMPPSKMLDYFGADSLTYIPGQSFLEIARPSGAVCTDCFEA